MDTLDRATIRKALRRRSIAQRILKHGDEHDEKHHGNWATGRAGGSGGDQGEGKVESSASKEKPAQESSPTPTASASDVDAAPPGATDAAETASPTRAPASVLNDLSKEIGEDPQYIQTMRENAKVKIGKRLDQIDEHAGFGKMSDPKKGKRGSDTMGLYGEWEGGEFKGWGDRAQFHSDLLNEYKRRQIEENDGRAPKAERTAIVMAGLPGSGKSFTLKNSDALASKFDLRDFLMVNADDMKGMIAEASFDDLVGANPIPDDMEPLKPGEMASLVHEESSFLSKALAKSERALGTNIALDITAQDGEKTMSKHIQPLIDAGYTVHVVHVDVSLEEATASALNRFANGMDKPEGGRPVPEAFLNGLASESDTRLDKVNDAMEVYDSGINGELFWVRNFPVSGALSREDSSIQPRAPIDLTAELQREAA